MLKRNKNLQNALDGFTKRVVNKTQEKAEKEKVCIWCGEKITGFKDELSRKEYKISGLCQKCQDETFI